MTADQALDIQKLNYVAKKNGEPFPEASGRQRVPGRVLGFRAKGLQPAGERLSREGFHIRLPGELMALEVFASLSAATRLSRQWGDYNRHQRHPARPDWAT